MWNVLENGYLEPHDNTRIDIYKERGKVRSKFNIQVLTAIPPPL